MRRQNYRSSWLRYAVAGAGLIGVDVAAAWQAVAADMPSRPRIDVEGATTTPKAMPSHPDSPPTGQENRRPEPPARSNEQPGDRSEQDEGADADGPGCPANQRRLDLLV